MSTVLVLGGAECVWCDLEELCDLAGLHRYWFAHGTPCDEHNHPAHWIPLWPGPVIAVNDIGCVWPRRLDHWATMHPEKLPDWMRLRETNGHPGGYTTWSHKRSEGVDRHIGGQPLKAKTLSSGLFAAYGVAREIGAERVVACGMPMTNTPHFTESVVHDESPWKSADGFWTAFESLADELGFFRSMSGRTRELFGPPPREWVEGTEALV